MHESLLWTLANVLAITTIANTSVAADKLISLSAEDTFISRINKDETNGDTVSLLVGDDALDGFSDNAVMVKFPNITLPEGGSLVKASLSLLSFVSSPDEDSPADRFMAHRLLKDWNDQDSTYQSAFGGDGIQADGMQDAEAQVSFSFPPHNLGIFRFDVTNDVAYWLENPDQNFGWGIISNQVGSDGIMISSAESADEVKDGAPALWIQTDLPFTQTDRKNHKIKTVKSIRCDTLSNDDLLWVGEKKTSQSCKKKCLKRKTKCIGFQFESDTSACTLYKDNHFINFNVDVPGTDCGFLRFVFKE